MGQEPIVQIALYLLKPYAVGIDSFNRVPSGPRPVAWISTRGALPTRLNECAILNRARNRDWFLPLFPNRFISTTDSDASAVTNSANWRAVGVNSRTAGFMNRTDQSDWIAPFDVTARASPATHRRSRT